MNISEHGVILVFADHALGCGVIRGSPDAIALLLQDLFQGKGNRGLWIHEEKRATSAAVHPFSRFHGGNGLEAHLVAADLTYWKTHAAGQNAFMGQAVL